MPVLRFTGTCVLVASLMIATGCGSRGPQMADVEGTVKLNGKPLERIAVEFWPESDGPRSIGETDKEGKFVLMSDSGKRKGASVGKHKVILRDAAVLGDKFLGRAAENVDMSQGRKSRLTKRYTEAATTPLTREVKPGKNTIDLDLDAP